MYDSSVKVPCIMSRPGHVPGSITCDELYSQYDFMPTLLDYVGLGNPQADALPGQSFAGLLRGGSTAGRDSVVVYDEYGPVRMIRSRTAKYVHRYPDGPHEYYDLVQDPDETTNLVDNPARGSEVRQMRAELVEWFRRYSAAECDGHDKPVTGSGQNGLASAPQEGNVPFAQGNMPWWKPGEERR
jgi:arylsulfatase A-like enzyme